MTRMIDVVDDDVGAGRKDRYAEQHQGDAVHIIIITRLLGGSPHKDAISFA
jgi:hypothetical protein